MQNPQNKEDYFIVFCDGACSGNPGPGGWGSIVRTPDHQVVELGGKGAHTTNNRMEMMAALAAMKWIDHLHGSKSVIGTKAKIHTDSKYLILGMTQWVQNWVKQGWIKKKGQNAVANQDLWIKLLKSSESLSIAWIYVPGHRGILGNERADEIAVSFSKGKPTSLFSGAEKNYLFQVQSLKE